MLCLFHAEAHYQDSAVQISTVCGGIIWHQPGARASQLARGSGDSRRAEQADTARRGRPFMDALSGFTPAILL
eukprot:6181189-Pleurochrysis_carterae.AAC.3